MTQLAIIPGNGTCYKCGARSTRSRPSKISSDDLTLELCVACDDIERYAEWNLHIKTFTLPSIRGKANTDLERLEYACNLVMPSLHDCLEGQLRACEVLIWLLIDEENGVIQYVDRRTQVNFRGVADLYQRCLIEAPQNLNEWEKIRRCQVGDCIGMTGYYAARGAVESAASAAANLVSIIAFKAGKDREECIGIECATRLRQYRKCSDMLDESQS